MLKFLGVATVLLAMAASSTLAVAHSRHHRHGYDHRHEFRLGYHRAGPPRGYRFGFATYAGDPFARDDYYDGGRCYYLHRTDFCRGPRPLDWLR